MESHREDFFRKQLHERRRSLEQAMEKSGETERLVQLLQQVDSALEKLDDGSFGICPICNEPVEEERLLADPLISICLPHFDSQQQRMLEADLELAFRIQNRLLPRCRLDFPGWEVDFTYKPAGIVSGDYLDLVVSETEPEVLYALIGDVSGKGVAASMLMSHLHAMFRSLLGTATCLPDLAKAANRIFCESTLATHYATLVFCRIRRSGEVEICNAGHNAPLLVHDHHIRRLGATGVPFGMFCDSVYAVESHQMEPGDLILFYTDGLTETMNRNDEEYGDQRLHELVLASRGLDSAALLKALANDIDRFREERRRIDDLTVLGIQRSFSG